MVGTLFLLSRLQQLPSLPWKCHSALHLLWCPFSTPTNDALSVIVFEDENISSQLYSFEVDRFYFTHKKCPALLKAGQPFPHSSLGSKKRALPPLRASWRHWHHLYFLPSQIQCRGQSHAPVYTSHNTRPLFINKCLEVQSNTQANKNLWGLSAGGSHRQQWWPGKSEGKWGCSRESKEYRAKGRGCYRYLKSWGIKREEKATEGESQLFFLLFSFFYFSTLIQGIKELLKKYTDKCYVLLSK